MQADEFEKKIKNKLEEFALAPNESAWDEVALRINQEKKKRRALVYWLVTGFILLAGTSAYWFIDKRENTTKYVDIKTAPEKESYKINKNVNNTAAEFKKSDKKTFAKKTVNKTSNNKFSAHNYKLPNLASIETVYTKPVNKDFSVIPKKEQKNIVISEKISAESLPHAFYNPGLATKTNDSGSVAIKTKSEFQEDTLSNANLKKTITAKKQIRKWKAGFSVYGGISDNLSGLPGTEKSLAFDASPINYNNGTNAGNTQKISGNFNAAFSFGLGFFVMKPLNKKLSLSAGIDYHFYSAKSRVGRSITSSSIVYDSADQRYTSLQNYYSMGDTANYLNKYHLVQLPVNVELQINKNLEKPFVVFAGISPGYMFNSNALYANESASIFYVDKQKFCQFSLSAQAGFSFPLIASSAYLLSAGPAIQYSFTNLIKFAGAAQHLSFAGIKATVVLK